MPAATPRPQINGVLAVNASQTSGNANRQGTTKPPSPRLKVVIRRLPPALNLAEFTTILGDDWKVGQGKVNWLQYKPGKDSKDASKPSRPARAYLHLTDESYLLALSDTVRQSVFEDAQNTFTNPCLIGPPTVEFAPYGRIPVARPRVDARAGTIDQDPEFMAFLEGLANPTSTKEANVDADGSSSKHEKVTTTPLVQYLKEKKANKNKEAAAKAAKKQEAQITKGKGSKDSSTAAEDAKKKGKDTKPDKAVEKAAKDAVKILNREAAAKVAAGPSGLTSDASGSESTGTPKLDIGKVPGRQRGAVIAAHIRMLQRDLGLSPAQAHRQVRRDTVDAQKAERAAAAEKAATETKDASSSQALPPQQVPTAPRGNQNQPANRRGRGKQPVESEANKATAVSTPGPATPITLLKKPEAPQSSTLTPAATPTPQPPKPAPSMLARKPPAAVVPSEGATHAFVKHANPSQGVTEDLLKEAMEKFGPVSKVEIDKRKGFAYVDFADTEGLKKAMGANPISVAQGTVHVMQRKGTALPPERKPLTQAPHAPRGGGVGGGGGGGRGGRGGTIGRRGGRGGAPRSGPNAVQAQPSSENTKPNPSPAPSAPAAAAK